VRVPALGGEGVLGQVVRADADKSDLGEQVLDAQRRGRRLNHDAQGRNRFIGVQACFAACLVEKTACATKLVARRHHWQEDVKCSGSAGAVQGTRLCEEQVRMAERSSEHAGDG
jgi:hypothetical protein